jgi:hypothetical protein
MLRKVEEDEFKPSASSPEAPFVEVGIYRADAADSQTFADVLNALAELGLTPTGEINVWPERHHFASITDELSETTRVAPDDVPTLIEQRSPFVLQVRLSGYFPGESILTYLSISRRGALVDHHPIALWASGTEVAYEPAAHSDTGPLARRALLHLAERVKPSYGAITIDYPLECPCDLARNPESEAFSDFFIKSNYLSSAETALIRETFDGAYIEDLAPGFFVSCTDVFNPLGITVASSLEKSGVVAEMIGLRCSGA